ncbi:TPA: phage major capsid protein [Streptococcus suis]|uniref:phage major capsid protein n=1 Tax=Streptococcus suis TaxID=1307 RepID=UPI0004021C46|nr:phage major capsid protein [Streptococcus suis]NQM40345.1 phage major capsid protein [Streptococcus suis]QWS31645.1 phage major capsid protein [Streptococcus suis]HEM2809906.1 phage major capsid protein [Streptococcus suis]HEM3173036.1 phage major capsid protein [Streptococcus suis]HEM4055532.1 phage major capsid protein [Streptococcus suis]
MAQKFNPDTVLLSETLGKEITSELITDLFTDSLVKTSKVVQLGQKVEMDGKMVRKGVEIGQLTDAYFVGEGQKIGTAKVQSKSYILEARKIAVILPVTEEVLNYTWTDYFDSIKDKIVDLFNKKIDGAAFLGLHNNPFGANVLAAAKKAGNVVSGDITLDSIYDVEDKSDKDPNAFVGHRTINRILRSIRDDVNGGQHVFEKPANPNATGELDGLPYAQLQLQDGQTYPAGTLITGNFNGLVYGIPNGTNLRLKIADQATLSKVQNDGTLDSGDVHLFEQDMQALRAIFEIAVAIPNDEAFAAIQPVGV